MNATQLAKTTNGTAVEELDVLVIGAGFAGLYQLDHLRRLGYNVEVFEAGSDIGGIWYWNCYPGARVDSYGPLYQFSSEQLWRDWNYSELYPSWEELRAYFRHVDKKLGLSRDIRFNTRVTGAEFDTDRDQWVVQASDGSVTRAKFFVLCTGLSAKPYIPPIEGLKDFRGGHAGTRGASVYAASKHAVEGLTKSAALEVASSGVRVNAVAPGPTETGMPNRFTGNAERKAGLVSTVPLGRVGEPDKIARAIVFLASNKASFVTGQILGADGGKSAG